ncbi:MAG TPA: acyltransferase family protein, partial [Microthrixaceae bacterium]|nr:acyltransferase family protein [Microthrixaceae bacterium]
MTVDRTAGSERSFGLDIARVLAAIAVLISHVAFVTGVVNPERWDSWLRLILPRLDVGVPVFFVLSGLLVGRPFVRSLVRNTDPPDLATFTLRRFARIFPLYWVVLAATLAFGAGAAPSPQRLVATMALVHIYVPGWAIGPITQSWT